MAVSILLPYPKWGKGPPGKLLAPAPWSGPYMVPAPWSGPWPRPHGPGHGPAHGPSPMVRPHGPVHGPCPRGSLYGPWLLGPGALYLEVFQPYYSLVWPYYSLVWPLLDGRWLGMLSHRDQSHEANAVAVRLPDLTCSPRLPCMSIPRSVRLSTHLQSYGHVYFVPIKKNMIGR